MVTARPTLAVWKLASCDGCQLSLLDCEAELLTLAEHVTIAHFLEASSAVLPGPYDLSLVEGSVTTAADAERLREIRRQSRRLVAIGACATAGGIQALRNLADVQGYVRAVYPEPGFIATLATSTAVADHVAVDAELRGCPVDRGQLLEVVGALLHDRRPALPTASVCWECKQRGVPCVVVAAGTACLGPVTQAGCGAICPAHRRGCYGCFGPSEDPNLPALSAVLARHGTRSGDTVRLLRTFNVAAAAFASESARLAEEDR